MQVYRSQATRVGTDAALNGLAREVVRLATGPIPAADALTSLLIDCTEIGAGLIDEISPARDDVEPRSVALEHAMRTCAGAWVAALAGDEIAVRRRLRALRRLIEDAAREVAPAFTRRVSEGFAYYALLPEAYEAVARELARDLRGRRCICVGIRTIGASLGAIVAATLEREGVDAWFTTVRPRGHPFARMVEVGPLLRAWWSTRRDELFLIVDEGPGLSGTSMTSVAAALGSLGVPDEAIVLVPSWTGNPDAFVSPEARRRWRRYRCRPATFEHVWPSPDDLAQHWGAARIDDVGAGRWRTRALSPRDWPAVNPRHERRKFVLGHEEREAPPTLVKFAGLGHYGAATVARGNQAAAAGWSPEVHLLGRGWISHEWVPGTSMHPRLLSGDFIDHLASYLTWVGRARPAGGVANPGPLAEMTRLNLSLVMGPWAEAVVDARKPQANDVPAVHVDNRLAPHEWVRTATGFVKTDGIDHGDDHFFPGPTDIAWDLAGACEEWQLEPAAEAHLIDRYVAGSGDRHVRDRLPFYRMAYLAFRAAYADLSLDGVTPDEQVRFLTRLTFYNRRLQEVLA